MRLVIATLLAITLVATTACGAELDLGRIKLPPGYAIELWARAPNARQMALGESTLFIGSRREVRVYALELEDGGRRAGKLRVLASGLRQPNGVAFKDGALYVAEIARIIRFDAIESRLDDPPPPVVLPVRLPAEEHHGWKYIAFGPDGRLYAPVGAPCNICDPGDPYAAILRLNPDGSGLEIFARGVRNTVGFDWQPGTGAFWFTDNGRDWLGDDRPPDELNRAERAGLHFGYPYCHGRNIRDPGFGQGRDCAQFTPPVRELGPHVAALGMKFYRGRQFPADCRGDVFIAEHGSWNRSTPIGYRITRVSLRDPAAPTYEVFAEGWLNGRLVMGRPVDLVEAPDGALLISDDHAGAIYRISYRP